MKNALHPSSTSARVVARHTETYDTIVRDASTTRICDEGENRGVFGTRSGHLYNVTVARG
jgi:hypothetical protein